MMQRLRSRPFVQLALTLVLALLLAYGLQRYVVGVFRVPSTSMSRTLLPGDRMLAARFWYAIERPSRGDIAVLHPNGEGDRVFYADGASRRIFVKRIIGLPGEWVKARHGRVSICTGPGGSGCVPLSEPYVRGTTQSFGPIAVPPGRYFVMGDNRRDSEDSRVWGPVRRGQLLGRAFGLVWPPLRIRFF
jgi:signal peptidase I